MCFSLFFSFALTILVYGSLPVFVPLVFTLCCSLWACAELPKAVMTLETVKKTVGVPTEAMIKNAIKNNKRKLGMMDERKAKQRVCLSSLSLSSIVVVLFLFDVLPLRFSLFFVCVCVCVCVCV